MFTWQKSNYFLNMVRKLFPDIVDHILFQYLYKRLQPIHDVNNVRIDGSELPSRAVTDEGMEEGTMPVLLRASAAWAERVSGHLVLDSSYPEQFEADWKSLVRARRER